MRTWKQCLKAFKRNSNVGAVTPLLNHLRLCDSVTEVAATARAESKGLTIGPFSSSSCLCMLTGCGLGNSLFVCGLFLYLCQEGTEWSIYILLHVSVWVRKMKTTQLNKLSILKIILLLFLIMCARGLCI